MSMSANTKNKEITNEETSIDKNIAGEKTHGFNFEEIRMKTENEKLNTFYKITDEMYELRKKCFATYSELKKQARRLMMIIILAIVMINVLKKMKYLEKTILVNMAIIAFEMLIMDMIMLAYAQYRSKESYYRCINAHTEMSKLTYKQTA